MNLELTHSVILIITIGLAFLFPGTILASYDLQISAALFIVFFVVKKLLGNKIQSRLIESVIFTFVILLTVNATGGLTSPFFFLLYFLLFSLSLLLEPVISITTTIAMMAFFIVYLPPNQEFHTLLPLFSLAFLTPFALFMGQEYIESQKAKVKGQKLETELANTKKDTFLFLSLMLKNHLKSIMYSLDNFMGDHELHSIKKHVRNMRQLIEKFEHDNA